MTYLDGGRKDKNESQTVRKVKKLSKNLSLKPLNKAFYLPLPFSLFTIISFSSVAHTFWNMFWLVWYFRWNIRRYGILFVVGTELATGSPISIFCVFIVTAEKLPWNSRTSNPDRIRNIHHHMFQKAGRNHAAFKWSHYPVKQTQINVKLPPWDFFLTFNYPYIRDKWQTELKVIQLPQFRENMHH